VADQGRFGGGGRVTGLDRQAGGDVEGREQKVFTDKALEDGVVVARPYSSAHRESGRKIAGESDASHGDEGEAGRCRLGNT
jgi:hypothetical protein